MFIFMTVQNNEMKKEEVTKWSLKYLSFKMGSYISDTYLLCYTTIEDCNDKISEMSLKGNRWMANVYHNSKYVLHSQQVIGKKP